MVAGPPDEGDEAASSARWWSAMEKRRNGEKSRENGSVRERMVAGEVIKAARLGGTRADTDTCIQTLITVPGSPLD